MNRKVGLKRYDCVATYSVRSCVVRILMGLWIANLIRDFYHWAHSRHNGALVFRILPAFLIFCSCVDSGMLAPPELVGTWVLSSISAGKFPAECQTLRLEFTSDRRLIATSGELIFITKLSIKRRNGGFLIHQEIVEYNDKPNCQGKSAHYVASNFLFDIYFERDGAVLRQYFGAKKSDRYVEFIRAA